MLQFKEIDINVLKKYDKPGPRYTSYPTAPVFSDKFGSKEYREEILSTNSNNKAPDLSLYFHFPFCDTLCYFCGCTMLITHDKKRISEYNDYIKKEIDITVPLMKKSRKVQQLHWGGGTPSYLTPDEIRDIGIYTKEHFDFDDDIEASVEIDPRGLTRQHMVAFRDAGFNRVSMGVQDFNLKVQETINRVQSEEITRDAVNWSRELGFKSINLDLIYGLPFQTTKSFELTLDKIIEISPDRIAVFNYAHVPWLKKHQRVITNEMLPSPENKLSTLKMTIEKLQEAGYWYIGMDHFAKPDDELAISQRNKTLYRNFQGYSTKAGCDVYAFGMSAISQFDSMFAQNYKSLPDYYSRINSGEFATKVGYKLTGDDKIRRYTINKLMCDMELTKSDIENKFNIVFDDYFRNDIPKLAEFIEGGFMVSESGKYRVVNTGKLIIRNIAMCFDAYLEKMMMEKPIFSRTV
ncbi:MAG: oxygen-independent coproporphyrinogen III oxidase [Ignavibacteria bacterium]